MSGAKSPLCLGASEHCETLDSTSHAIQSASRQCKLAPVHGPNARSEWSAIQKDIDPINIQPAMNELRRIGELEFKL
jgi:hypothetical protein